MKCPYCDNDAQWVENKEIYGKNYGKSYMMWLCKPCDAYVGCHHNTKSPLGTLANRELREWRKQTHKAIDPFWKEGLMSRKRLYQLMEEHFGEEIHVGESNIQRCKEIIKWSETNPVLKGEE